MDIKTTKIKNIAVQNFTAFHDLKIEFCDGVNVIIGENGTGKTHLLKLLSMFGNVALGTDASEWCVLYTISVDIDFVNCARNSIFHPSISINDVLLYDESLNNLVDERVRKAIPLWNDAIKFSVFIPAKEMLSNSDIVRIHENFKKELYIDLTLIDIINHANYLLRDNPSDLALSISTKIEKIIGGSVFIHPNDKQFWIKKADGTQVPYRFEAEGFNKLGLLWRLVMNGSIHQNTVLLWDEPEANLNPSIIPHVVDILFDLANHGVQIFVSTHDYILAKYFEVRVKDENKLMYQSLFKSDKGVVGETCKNFRDLKNNPIISSFNNLMLEVIQGNMGD